MNPELSLILLELFATMIKKNEMTKRSDDQLDVLEGMDILILFTKEHPWHTCSFPESRVHLPRDLA